MKKSDPVRIAEIERSRDIALQGITLIRDNPVIGMVAGVAAVKGLERLGLFSDTIANVMVGTIITAETLNVLSQSGMVGILKDVVIGGSAGAIGAAAAAKLLATKAAPVVAPVAEAGGISAAGMLSGLLGAGLLIKPIKRYVAKLKAGGEEELMQA